MSGTHCHGGADTGYQCAGWLPPDEALCCRCRAAKDGHGFGSPAAASAAAAAANHAADARSSDHCKALKRMQCNEVGMQHDA